MNWADRADYLRQKLEDSYSSDRSGYMTWRMAADAVAAALELDEYEATYVFRWADRRAANDAEAELQRQQAANDADAEAEHDSL